MTWVRTGVYTSYASELNRERGGQELQIKKLALARRLLPQRKSGKREQLRQFKQKQ